MKVYLLQLPQRLLLLGAAAVTTSALETADLVNLCRQKWQGDGLLLCSHPASRKFYFMAQDTDRGLWWWAEAPSNRVRFQLCFFLVYSMIPAFPVPLESLASNTSCPEWDPGAPGSYLQFYKGPSGVPWPLGPPVCGLTIPAPVASSGPSMGLRLVTRGCQPRVNFVGEVTSFWLGFCGGYFRRWNGRCIPPSLVCDRWDIDNCGDGSDRASQPPASCRVPPSLIHTLSPLPSLPPGSQRDAAATRGSSITSSPALGSAGPLRTAAERTTPAGQDPALQGAASKGRQM
uniref:Low density lipoprotein receptor class A domain containing 2 n=1 Tax=Loxodonta africana TaxID=9785 RepID=G3SPQ4_LOXAF